MTAGIAFKKLTNKNYADARDWLKNANLAGIYTQRQLAEKATEVLGFVMPYASVGPLLEDAGRQLDAVPREVKAARSVNHTSRGEREPPADVELLRRVVAVEGQLGGLKSRMATDREVSKEDGQRLDRLEADMQDMRRLLSHLYAKLGEPLPGSKS